MVDIYWQEKGEIGLLEINKRLLRTLFFAACGCILLYWVLHDAERVDNLRNTISDITAPFVLGGVLAFILNVPMRFLEEKLFQNVKMSKKKWGQKNS